MTWRDVSKGGLKGECPQEQGRASVKTPEANELGGLQSQGEGF